MPTSLAGWRRLQNRLRMDSGPVPFRYRARASQNDDTLSHHFDPAPGGLVEIIKKMKFHPAIGGIISLLISIY
ncbi:hypothetical protein COT63_00195 [Candidatus Shapirobacteria bacterium CG09_land_8_20_14_0_10_38_17]|uniref:Uncharacterized protein n=1 Tax=Candidatus Shapirobacteria bacterium CG09_land_8_20_14_0_10_38_17 TaxID=1974884 RepID=A0A2H0WRY0_9BACT|nr:MAG: hypothetical protein COT63_00195 [Candidatus Shapirobacteria bacterium CG09_land_8_20_14_0_10_38_17]